MNRHDITGDGAADIVVTSPWGLGVLALQGGTIVARTLVANGTPLGDWRINTHDNNVELRADMDGDGIGELLMSSPWGIGLLKFSGNGLRSIAMAPNGRRVGGWIVDTTNNQFLHAGDFDGDERDEVLVTSPWGLGILEYGTDFGSRMLAPNGTRFGGWLLSTADNSFPLVADLDGDGRAEIVVTSGWGLGILKLVGNGLTSIVMAPNGTMFGSWRLDTTTDRVEVAADLNGDGRAELVLRNDSGLVVLRQDGGSLHALATARTGTSLGAWHLDAARDRLGVAGDFDRNGRAEILVTGDNALGLLALEGGALVSRLRAPNGTLFGHWRLNTRDNRINHAADFDRDQRAELMISSPWGIGILKFDGSTFTAVTMSPNGTRFGGWLLNTADNDLEAGLGQSWALLLWHHDWTGSVSNTSCILRERGYTITATQDAQDALSQLGRLALQVRPADRVFVYFAAHGGSGRSLTDRRRSTALTHTLQFGQGALVSYDRIAPWLRRIAAAGADLTVLDGSCNGGESVLAAMGERYLALSTTAARAVGIINSPDPSAVMSCVGKPNSFGLWWSAERSASVLTALTPHRFFQKIYRNDDTEVSELSLFYKRGIICYQAVGGDWDLKSRSCYLYRYVYPDGYENLKQKEKDALTVSATAYLASMRSDLNAYAPPIARLREILNDSSLVGRAADVYAAAYPAPWQALLGDMNWNVETQPVRKSPNGSDIEPRVYAGRSGFLKLVVDIQRTLVLFAQSYEEQERLLRSLDAEIERQGLPRGSALQAAPRATPSITDYLEFNEFDDISSTRWRGILSRAPVAQSRILEKLHSIPTARLTDTRFSTLLQSEWSVIQEHVAVSSQHPNIDDLVTRIHAIQASDYRLKDLLFFNLTIAEEAISRASAHGEQAGDLVSF